MTMTKKQAVEIFGSQSAIARALGISRGAISLWPDVLTQRQHDEVVGAAFRLGMKLSFSVKSRSRSGRKKDTDVHPQHPRNS